MSKERKYEDWPRFKQLESAPAFIGGSWRRIQAEGAAEFSTARLRIRGFDSGQETAHDEWEIRLTRNRTHGEKRKRLDRTFRCSMRIGNRLPINLGVGQCGSWEDAVEAASASCDVASALRANGARVYDRAMWLPVRPFTVVYPWTSPDEPNAQLSPFRLVGSWRFEPDDRGCIAMQYAANHETMRELATTVGANALIVDRYDPDGRLRLYHRRGMTEWDSITEDELHARLIAGVDLGY